MKTLYSILLGILAVVCISLSAPAHLRVVAKKKAGGGGGGGGGFDKTSLVIWLDLDNSLTNQANPGTLDATARGTSQGYMTDPFGDTNGALLLSSTASSWASITGTAGFDPSGDWSMVWWMKDTAAFTGTFYFIWKWDTQHQFYVLRQTSTNDRLGLAISNDASGGEERVLGAIGDYPGDDSAWHHYAITYKSSTSTAKFYVDGVVKETGEVYTTETGALHAAGTNNSLILGSSHLTNAAATLDGGIARWSWWHRELSSTEISTLYNSGGDKKYADLANVSTSYANSGGTGDRTGSITLTVTGSLNGSAVGTPNVLLDGVTSGATNLYFNNNSANSYGFKFDFGTAKIINEAKFHQENTTSHGTWKWQGSNDGSSWTDIGSSFTFGGAAIQTQTSLSGNTTAYRYYQVIGVSGTASNSPYIYEFEFKIN